MTVTATEYHVPYLPVARPFCRRYEDRADFAAWRRHFAFWMKYRGAEPPTAPYRVRATVRRLVGGQRNAVTSHIIELWRESLALACHRWVGRAPADVAVTFEPLTCSEMESPRLEGTYVMIEEA